MLANQPGFDEQLYPETAFVDLFQHNVKFRNKFGTRTRPLRSSIIGRCRRRSFSELILNHASFWILRDMVYQGEDTQRELLCPVS